MGSWDVGILALLRRPLWWWLGGGSSLVGIIHPRVVRPGPGPSQVVQWVNDLMSIH